MPWQATTIWGETSYGKAAEKFKLKLEEQHLTSSIQPQGRRLRHFLRTPSPTQQRLYALVGIEPGLPSPTPMKKEGKQRRRDESPPEKQTTRPISCPPLQPNKVSKVQTYKPQLKVVQRKSGDEKKKVRSRKEKGVELVKLTPGPQKQTSTSALTAAPLSHSTNEAALSSVRSSPVHQRGKTPQSRGSQDDVLASTKVYAADAKEREDNTFLTEQEEQHEEEEMYMSNEGSQFDDDRDEEGQKIEKRAATTTTPSRSPSPPLSYRNISPTLSDIERKEYIESRREKRIQQQFHEKTALYHQRVIDLKQHTEEVKNRCEKLRQKKVEATKEKIKEKARRFLDPIDRCQTEAERRELRAETFSIILQHALLVRQSYLAVQMGRSFQVLKFLFLPMFHLWQRRRTKFLVQIGLLWANRMKRPGIDRLRHEFPVLHFWPEFSLKRLCKKLVPRRFLPGEIIAYEGEPVSCAFVITQGRISVKQRLHPLKKEKGGKNPTRQLSTKKGEAVFGEECILKQYNSTHFAKLVCIEETHAWCLSKKVYQGETMCVPQGAVEEVHQEAAKKVAQGEEQAGSKQIDHSNLEKGIEISGNVLIPLTAHQVRENKIFHFWDLKDLEELLSCCQYQEFERGDVIYEAGRWPHHVYIVWRGTVEIALAPTRNDTQLLGEGSSGNLLGQLQRSSSSLNEETQPAIASGGSWHSLSRLRRGTGVGGSSNNLQLGRTYLNVGQCFGEEAVVFDTRREGTATAATEVVVYKIPKYDFLNGIVLYPAEFLSMRQILNNARAHKLVKPPSSALNGLIALSGVQTAFYRSMTACCVGRGDFLPLTTSVVFLHQGSVTWQNNVEVKAPALLLSAEVFQHFMNVHIDEAAAEQQAPQVAASSNPPGANTVAGGKTGGLLHTASNLKPTSVQFTSNNLGESSSSLDPLGRSGSTTTAPTESNIKVLHYCNERCDFWAVPVLTLIRKAKNLTKYGDIVPLEGEKKAHSYKNEKRKR